MVSLLMARGHVNAATYPVGRAVHEARLVAQREAREAVRHVALMPMAIAAALDKKAARSFARLVSEAGGAAPAKTGQDLANRLRSAR